MASRWTYCAACAFCVAWATGCGSDDGSGNHPDGPIDYGSGACPDFTPCGGDVTGSWTLESTCFDPPNDYASCAGASRTHTYTGTLTFGADGSYVVDLIATTHLVLPADCVATTSDCDPTAGCVIAGDGSCTCDSTEPSSLGPTTWTVASTDPTAVILTFEDGTELPLFYCQTGTRLTLRGEQLNQRFVYALNR